MSHWAWHAMLAPHQCCGLWEESGLIRAGPRTCRWCLIQPGSQNVLARFISLLTSLSIQVLTWNEKFHLDVYLALHTELFVQLINMQFHLLSPLTQWYKGPGLGDELLYVLILYRLASNYHVCSDQFRSISVSWLIPCNPEERRDRVNEPKWLQTHWPLWLSNLFIASNSRPTPLQLWAVNPFLTIMHPRKVTERVLTLQHQLSPIQYILGIR